MKQLTATDCPLFAGLNSGEIEYAKEFFSIREKHFDKGESIKRSGDILPFFGFVIKGNIQVYIYDAEGRKTIMASLLPGMTFGQSMCFLAKPNDVYIVAEENSLILQLRADRIKNPSVNVNPVDTKLTNAFIADLAKRTLDMNRRIQILSKTGIDQKVITLLSGLPKDRDGFVSVKMSRDDMASYIGVNRSALSRVLSEMKEAGVIDYKKDRFRVKITEK